MSLTLKLDVIFTLTTLEERDGEERNGEERRRGEPVDDEYNHVDRAENHPNNSDSACQRK